MILSRDADEQSMQRFPELAHFVEHHLRAPTELLHDKQACAVWRAVHLHGTDLLRRFWLNKII
jgi:hypothetical protein